MRHLLEVSLRLYFMRLDVAIKPVTSPETNNLPWPLVGALFL